MKTLAVAGSLLVLLLVQDTLAKDCGPSCRIFCAFGYMKDSRGCDTCVCASPAHETYNCANITCMMSCGHGFVRDKKGCYQCQCAPPPHETYVDVCEDVNCDVGKVCKNFSLTSSRHVVPKCVDPHIPDRCQQPMDPGPCKGSKEHWYYSADSGVCEKFLFGGCMGNINNYESEQECRLMCVPEIEPEDCPVVDCLPCLSGHATDRLGCQTCECKDKSVDCTAPACYMYCQHGFQKDAKGCPTCSCANTPIPLVNPCAGRDMCQLFCKHGYEKDQNGCDMCRCRTSPPCLDAPCDKLCTYGYAKSWDGCPLCECAADPCEGFPCGTDHYCITEEKDVKHVPTCVAYQAERPWCAGRPVCTNQCPLGRQIDQQGCDTCECMDAPAACTRQACGTNPDNPECPFGNMYDSKGCLTCDCLPDPCQTTDACQTAGFDACEVIHPYTNCASCPALHHCLSDIDPVETYPLPKRGFYYPVGHQVRQVQIYLEYVHESAQQLDLEKLYKTMMEKIVITTNMTEETIKALRVWELQEGTVAVEYYMITFGNKDLVHITKYIMEAVEKEQLQVIMDDLEFTPQEHSLTPRYSSSHTYPEDTVDDGEEGSDDEGSDPLKFFVAGAAVAALLVAVFVIVAVCCVRSHSKTKTRGGKHDAGKVYKQVPTEKSKDPSHA